MSDELIITGSFNAFWAGSRKSTSSMLAHWSRDSPDGEAGKQDRLEAIMRMSEVQEMTGLKREDLELFVSLSLIPFVEAGEDPLLAFKKVFCLVKIFEMLLN